jgi:two-component system chemotaxis response regulator CheY
MKTGKDAVYNTENVQPHDSSAGKFSFAVSAQQSAVFREALYMRSSRADTLMMIVEDQVFSLNLLQGMLGRKYRTCAATDAMIAWNLYLKHAPDIVFLDIELPEIDGHQLAGEIRKLDAHALIIMVTGNNYIKDVMQAKKIGASGFIVKPYSKNKILESIEKSLNERRLRG